MSNETVKPLFEDATASSELRNFVALARSDGPSQADLDRLSARVAPILGLSAALLASSAAVVGGAPVSAAAALGAPAAGMTPAFGAAASGAKVGLFSQIVASTTAKVLAVSLSAGAVGVGVWNAGGTDSRSRAPRAALSTPPSRAEPRAKAGVEQVATPAELAPSGQGEGETSPAEAAQPKSMPEALAAREQPRPERAARSGRAARSSAAQRSKPSAVKTVAAPEPAPVVAPAAPSEPEPAVAPPPAPPSELSLIRRAQALRDYGDEALALLAQHAQLYPRGALSQEREVLAVELLLKTHRRSQAKERASQFEDDYPKSAHLPRLHALLERADLK